MLAKHVFAKGRLVERSRSLSNNASSSLTVEILKERFKKFDKPDHYDYLVKKNPKVSRLKRASVLGML
jgi:hypothetical protein